MPETYVEMWILGQEDPLEEDMATHSSSLDQKKNRWTEEPGGLQSMGLQKSWTQLSKTISKEGIHVKTINTHMCWYLQIQYIIFIESLPLTP